MFDPATITTGVLSLIVAVTNSLSPTFPAITMFTRPLVEASAPQAPQAVMGASTIRPPTFQSNIPLPTLSAKAYVVQDLATGEVLLEKHPELPLLPASTTKIMTAIVARDLYRLDEPVIIDRAREATGHTAQLIAGETLTVEDLLKAVLISSGNDAAVALALHHPDGYEGFVASMNQKAAQLELKNSHFTNVSGIETPNHYMSASDLARLTAYASKDPLLAQIASQSKATITSIDGQFTHTLTSTNQLLSTVEGVKGFKTGWTPNAKECLVTLTQRQGNQVIIVVLGSDDRFGESEILIEWTFANHVWNAASQKS